MTDTVKTRPTTAARPRFVATRVQRPPSGAPLDEAIEPTAPAAVTGDDFGPLARFLGDPAVTDIFINGPNDLWVDRGLGLERPDGWGCPGEEQLRALAVRLVALGGRHIDEASPCVDVRLAGGVRLHAVLAPVSPKGTLISIRIPSRTPLSIVDLDAAGLFGGGASAGDDAGAEGTGGRGIRSRLERAVAARRNVLITGAGGSGKTTLLSALLTAVPPNERIVAIEDVAELQVPHPNFVSLEARQPNLEGAGAITLERLLREALRMRPDRLVLGECRGPEVRELFAALNTGHDGGAGTLHANSLADVPSRLEALGALAGLSGEASARQAVSAVDLVVHLERVGGVRRISGMGRLALDDRARLTVVPTQRAVAVPALRRG